MPGFTLKQLEFLVSVADAGSISAAAVKVHASPSAVSSAVTELERALGVQLCTRRKAHGVVLTATGRDAVRQARSLLTAADELALTAGNHDGELIGQVTVGCYSTLAPLILPSLLERFGRVHPGVDLDFTDGTQDEIQQQVLSGETDLAVLYRTYLDPGLETAAMYTTAARVLISADHRLAGADSVTLDNLADEPMILFDSAPSSRHTLSLFESSGITPLIRYRTAHFELARTLVGRGLGYTILVHHPANERSYEGRGVVSKTIRPQVVPTSVVIAWPRRVRPSPRARAVIDFVVGEYRSAAVSGTLPQGV